MSCRETQKAERAKWGGEGERERPRERSSKRGNRQIYRQKTRGAGGGGGGGEREKEREREKREEGRETSIGAALVSKAGSAADESVHYMQKVGDTSKAVGERIVRGGVLVGAPHVHVVLVVAFQHSPAASNEFVP